MLTADLVAARRYKGELRLVRLEGAARAEAEQVAAQYLEVAREHVGRAREELVSAWGAVEAGALSPRLVAGLRKLVEDGCVFDAEPPVDPVEVRRQVFERAAAARRALDVDGRFDRGAILADAAHALGVPAESVEGMLYADLRGANVLREAPSVTAASLVEAYDLAQAQAVLLRAVRVTCEIECRSAGAARAFFRKLKFLRLLPTLERVSDVRYRVVVDGPFSLFESVTKYGLKLAMLVPALAELDAYTLSADLRWGKEREPLVFKLAGGVGEGAVAGASRARAAAHLPDEVQALLDGVRQKGGPWEARPASAVIDLPGVGLCVPDLVFTHAERGDEVYLEVMGYWSREAVWRRVELAERGLKRPVLFAVSARLRVSEEALDEGASGALYVYKGAMSPRAVLERVERLAARRRG